jgi:environmental stress-induced protein Ves
MKTLPQVVIRLADCPPQPWKNGGGVTRELLAWPRDQQNPNDWQLRISVADITQDGAFSSFAGVHRSFAVIEGAGVRLQFAERLEIVTQDAKPLQFDGADAPYCELLAGETRDLNVMSKAGIHAKLVCAHASERLVARGYFDKATLTLTWLDTQAEMTAPSANNPNQLVGWWIGFE